MSRTVSNPLAPVTAGELKDAVDELKAHQTSLADKMRRQITRVLTREINGSFNSLLDEMDVRRTTLTCFALAEFARLPTPPMLPSPLPLHCYTVYLLQGLQKDFAGDVQDIVRNQLDDLLHHSAGSLQSGLRSGPNPLLNEFNKWAEVGFSTALCVYKSVQAHASTCNQTEVTTQGSRALQMSVCACTASNLL